MSKDYIDRQIEDKKKHENTKAQWELEKEEWKADVEPFKYRDPAELGKEGGDGCSEGTGLRGLADDFEKHCLLDKNFKTGKIKCHFCNFPATERVEIDEQIFYCCKEHGMGNPEETK